MNTPQNTITFVKIVKYTQTYTKKEFLKNNSVFYDGTDLNEEEKEKMWTRLIEKSCRGEITDPHVQKENDKEHGWTDEFYERVTEVMIAEIEKEKK